MLDRKARRDRSAQALRTRPRRGTLTCQWNRSSPAGPALQDVGGSRCKSCKTKSRCQPGGRPACMQATASSPRRRAACTCSSLEMRLEAIPDGQGGGQPRLFRCWEPAGGYAKKRGRPGAMGPAGAWLPGRGGTPGVPGRRGAGGGSRAAGAAGGRRGGPVAALRCTAPLTTPPPAAALRRTRPAPYAACSQPYAAPGRPLTPHVRAGPGPPHLHAHTSPSTALRAIRD